MSNPLEAAELVVQASSASLASGEPVTCANLVALACRLFAFDARAASPSGGMAASSSSASSSASSSSSSSSSPAPGPSTRVPVRHMALTLYNSAGKVLKARSDATGSYTFTGLAKGDRFDLQVHASGWTLIPIPIPYDQLTDVQAGWQEEIPLTNPAPGGKQQTVVGGLRYDILIENYFSTIEITFLRADGTAHGACRLAYLVRDKAERVLLENKGLETNAEGKVTVTLAAGAHRVLVNLKTATGQFHRYQLWLDALPAVVASERKNTRKRHYSIPLNGPGEVVDLPECAAGPDCRACSYSDRPHNTIEQIILGGYEKLGYQNEFDNSNQTGRYDVLGKLKEIPIPPVEIASLLQKFALPAMPAALTWQCSGQPTQSESGFIYVSSGRAAVLGDYLQCSPLVLWCLATGRFCDIVVDFTEYQAYVAMVNAAVDSIAASVMWYAREAGHAPQLDGQYPTPYADLVAAKEVADAAAKKTQDGKKARKPAGTAATAASSSTAPTVVDARTDDEDDVNPHEAEWRLHVAHRLRVVAPRPDGLQELPRGFGFNRHVGMLWMLQAYTRTCATIDDNTFGFTRSTAKAMEWLFVPGNIAPPGMPAQGRMSSSSSSSSASSAGTDPGDWLALAFSPCTASPEGRHAVAFDGEQLTAKLAGPPALNKTADNARFIQQLTVWNVACYRRLHGNDPTAMNYSHHFVTGKEDIDFHCRLMNSQDTRGLMLSTNALTLLKCRPSAAGATASASSSPAPSEKDKWIEAGLLKRLDALSPCFARLRTEGDATALQRLQSSFYGNGKTAPARLNWLDLARRINSALEQIFVTKEQK